MNIDKTAARIIRALDDNDDGVLHANDQTLDSSLVSRLDTDGDQWVTKDELIGHLAGAPEKQAKGVCKAAKKAANAVEHFRDRAFPGAPETMYSRNPLVRALSPGIYETNSKQHRFARLEADAQKQTLAARLADLLDKTAVTK